MHRGRRDRRCAGEEGLHHLVTAPRLQPLRETAPAPASAAAPPSAKQPPAAQTLHTHPPTRRPFPSLEAGPTLAAALRNDKSCRGASHTSPFKIPSPSKRPGGVAMQLDEHLRTYFLFVA